MQVRDMPDGSACWIAKPSITNQAAGICVFDRVSTLQAAVEAAEDLHEWVVQRYAALQLTWPPSLLRVPACGHVCVCVCVCVCV